MPVHPQALPSTLITMPTFEGWNDRVTSGRREQFTASHFVYFNFKLTV